MPKTLSQIITIAHQAELEGLAILNQFSYLELLRIYNGIGPDRFPDWLRDFVTEVNELFAPAALIHDVRYHIGGTFEDFTEANREFRRNCCTLAEQAYSWYDPRRYYWLFKAWRFAGYCQEFGWEGFHRSDPSDKSDPSEVNP